MTILRRRSSDAKIALEVILNLGLSMRGLGGAMPRMAEHFLSHGSGGKEAFVAGVVSAAFRNAAGSEAASFPGNPV